MNNKQASFYPDVPDLQYIEEGLSRGESMESFERATEMDKYQKINLTEKPEVMSDELSVEQRILKDFRTKGKVIWHTYNKSVPLEEMDVDFKVLAAIHSLKQANNFWTEMQQCQERAKECESNVHEFMGIFMTIEENLKENHDIDLPDEVENIKQLREELQNVQ